MPDRLDGLLAAGRNLSADTKSHAALREIPECWVMGEAAGLAAVVAIDDGVDVRAVDTARLQQRLQRSGAIVRRNATGGIATDGPGVTGELETSIHWTAVDAARADD